MHLAAMSPLRGWPAVALPAACILIFAAYTAEAQYDVLLPEDCNWYDDVSSCVEYYCDAYWDWDDYDSYDACLADLDHIADDETYEDVYLPDDCYQYDDIYSCIEYYCESYWQGDGFDSYHECRSNPFMYDYTYNEVFWPEVCESYDDSRECIEYYCDE